MVIIDDGITGRVCERIIYINKFHVLDRSTTGKSRRLTRIHCRLIMKHIYEQTPYEYITDGIK